jgi:hypothetical protein
MPDPAGPAVAPAARIGAIAREAAGIASWSARCADRPMIRSPQPSIRRASGSAGSSGGRWRSAGSIRPGRVCAGGSPGSTPRCSSPCRQSRTASSSRSTGCCAHSTGAGPRRRRRRPSTGGTALLSATPRRAPRAPRGLPFACNPLISRNRARNAFPRISFPKGSFAQRRPARRPVGRAAASGREFGGGRAEGGREALIRRFAPLSAAFGRRGVRGHRRGATIFENSPPTPAGPGMADRKVAVMSRTVQIPHASGRAPNLPESFRELRATADRPPTSRLAPRRSAGCADPALRRASKRPASKCGPVAGRPGPHSQTTTGGIP